jgi:8-oxo-dGTP diphosphatase
MSDAHQKCVHVAVGVVVQNNRVLLAKRAQHQHQGGLWEFPGGKVEPSEAVADALTRELQEELAIHVKHCQPLMEINHNYSDKSVCLDVWLVDEFTGQPTGVEGQPLTWASSEDLVARVKNTSSATAD